MKKIVLPILLLLTTLFATTALSATNVWVDTFTLLVTKAPVPTGVLSGDIAKADNDDALNLKSSWWDYNTPVPTSANRAFFGDVITANRTTVLGADTHWKGIAMVSNDYSWTISNDSNTLTLGSAGIDMAKAKAALTIAADVNFGIAQNWNVATSQTLTVSGTLTSDASEPLVKTGEGTLDLRGINTSFNGGLTVSNGILSIANAQALGTNFTRIGDAQIKASSAVVLDKDLELFGNTVFSSSSALTLNGVVSGPGSLTHTGSGTLMLNADNTYSGGTTNAGKIQIGSLDALSTGTVVMQNNSTIYADPPLFDATTGQMENDFILNGSATFETTFDSWGYMNFDGDISGPGSLTLTGYRFYLYGNNTFSGGLNVDVSNWLYFKGEEALGTGTITTKRNVLFYALAKATIANPIVMNNVFRLNPNSRKLVLEGAMSGSGEFQLIDNNPGTIEIPDGNPGRTGTTLHRSNYLKIGHPQSLGSGKIRLQGNSYYSFGVLNELTGANALANVIDIDGVYLSANLGDVYPIAFDLDYDLELSGTFSSSIDETLQFVEKKGPGDLILSGNATLNSPFNVLEGGLVLNTSNFGSIGVSIADGATLDINANQFFAGYLTAAPGSETTVSVLSDTAPLVGVGALSMGGILRLDFSSYSGSKTPVAGDVFQIFSGWSSVTDTGTEVRTYGLPPFLTTDNSNLFVDGTILIVPSRLSAQSLEITVQAGASETGEIIVTNQTRGLLDFEVPDIGNRPGGIYEVLSQSTSLRSFLPAQYAASTVITDWDDDTSLPMDIGFDMGVFGTTFTKFWVQTDGTVLLGKSGSEVARLSVYSGGISVDTDTVRYEKTADRLVIAWDVNPTASSFDTGSLQLWLNADGTIRYLYESGIWTGGSIGISGLENSQTTTLPLTANSLLFTPSTWVTNSPEEGALSAGGSRVVTFTADAAGQSEAEYSFITPVIFSDGVTESVQVFITVVGSAGTLELPPAVTFYGRAGLITHTGITVTNSGDIALSYEISYPAGSYTAQQVDYANNWISGGTTVPAADLGEADIDIGFLFTFFGTPYTELQINEDGTLTLGSSTIRVFSNELLFDSNASVTWRRDQSGTWFAATWNNLSISGGSDDYSFQAILNRDGSIRCNYLRLGSDWTDGVIRITDSSSVVNGTLVNDDTVTVTTNEEVYAVSTNYIYIGNSKFADSVNYATNTTVTTTYSDSVMQQAVRFTPVGSQIITASPVTGTVGAGGTANITLTGDARSLNNGGSNDVSTDTTLSFAYSGGTTNLDVTFVATNSVENVLSAAEVADMWGTSASEPKIAAVQYEPGAARTISWPEADGDSLSRVYGVWYTPSLEEDFYLIATVTNGSQFVDDDADRTSNSQGYYQVTVE
jgi:autotransporter-associated beta strand protein